MKKILIICIAFLIAVPALAENYLLNGGQRSQINYQMTQKIKPVLTTRTLVLSYVIPESFTSPTYRQKITNLKISHHQ